MAEGAQNACVGGVSGGEYENDKNCDDELFHAISPDCVESTLLLHATK